jgi:peptidoglycan/xylan/chitin deacetylase (PgdA/CDA1 family)
MYHKVGPMPPGTKLRAHYVSLRRFSGQLRLLRLLKFQWCRVADLWSPEAPDRAIALTFDDGYRNFLTHAWPILQAGGMGGTVFPVTRLLGCENSWDTANGERPEPLLTIEELKELDRAGAEIGSHTQTHADLVAVDPGKARLEIEQSRRDLQAILTQPIDVFCYPYGRKSAESERLVTEAGYRFATSTIGGWNTESTNPLELRRTNVRRDTSPSVLLFKLLRDRKRG